MGRNTEARRHGDQAVAGIRAVSQLPWPDKDREVWFSLGENHEKAYRLPDFLRRSTGREQLCATFFAESRRQFGGSTNIYRKSGLPDFLRRSTGREQLCATFFAKSRRQCGGSTNIYRKSGFGLHPLRNSFSASFAGRFLLNRKLTRRENSNGRELNGDYRDVVRLTVGLRGLRNGGGG
jgi:hypothetical protein